MMTIKPFSGASYRKNEARIRSEEYTACVLCGKGVKWPWPLSVVVVAGGAAFGVENSDPDDPGFMGYWPVGSDCVRKLRKAGVTICKDRFAEEGK